MSEDMAVRCMKHFPPFPQPKKEKKKKGNGGHDVAEGRQVRERRNGDDEWVLPVAA